MESEIVERHLTDPELFSLAIPAAGEPEALPEHLSECVACSRALLEWKRAARELAAEAEDVLGRRTSGEWEALEESTLAAIRGPRGTRRAAPLKWAVSIAASLLLAAFLLPGRGLLWRGAGSGAAVSVSAEDASDDALLREVNRLTRDDDSSSWSTLAPEPVPAEENS